MGLGSIVGGIVKSPFKLAASVTGIGLGLKVLGGFKDFMMGKMAGGMPPGMPGAPTTGAPGAPAAPGAPGAPGAMQYNPSEAFMTPLQQARMGIDPMAQFQQPAVPPTTQK